MFIQRILRKFSAPMYHLISIYTYSVNLLSLITLYRFMGLQANSKIILSVGGVIIVIASVACTLGVFGYIGVPTTLLTIEVCKKHLKI